MHCALRVISNENYTSYENSRKLCNLDTLRTRRNNLFLSFAIKCTKNEKTRDWFPLHANLANTKHCEKYEVARSPTDRLAQSAIPFMQRLLNKHEQNSNQYLIVGGELLCIASLIIINTTVKCLMVSSVI